MVLVVTELLAQLAYTLHERRIGHGDVRPNHVGQFLLAYKLPGIAGEMDEDLEGLRPQWHFVLPLAKATARQVDREMAEFQDLTVELLHA
jgi:hypothetical protein